jgi:hypothetical protein
VTGKYTVELAAAVAGRFRSVHHQGFRKQHEVAMELK